ncbi:MAG: zinc ribbon domain-containing protein [Bacilli bacterium]|nr:zinc ribbon domain-containing protein [Bacilli bacterium]MBO6284848.1 zinc ribbon domain-containing protein [Bacilli bacterium]
MPLFTDVIDLAVASPHLNLIEKYTFETKKSNVQIRVAANTEALLNGTYKIASGKSETFSRKTIGGSIVAYVYQPTAARKVIAIPFFAGQHTISLETNKMAKAKFALVGVARVSISDLKKLAVYFGKTVTPEEVENALVEKIKPSLTNMMTAAANAHIKVTTTNASVYEELKAIASEGMKDELMRKTLLDMGLMLLPSAIDLKLNPIGDSQDIIDAINAKYNEAALDSFEEAKKDKLRQQEIEDDMRNKQHEIDVINAQNTDTSNRNNNNTYNYNGQAPEPRPKPKAEKRFCTKCGKELDPKDIYCPICGTKAKE